MDTRGIIVPLITPLLADERLDQDGVARLVAHVIGGGVSGIFVLGSTGEGPTLPAREREGIVRAVKAQAAGRVPVLAGLYEVGTACAAEEGRRLAAWGADALVVTAPFYFSHTQDEIYAHIAGVARGQTIPTVVYNIPQMVKTIIEPETVQRLAEIPEIIGLKDSYGDMVRFQRALACQRPGFSVYQGAEGVVALSVACGAAGAVLGLANVAPALCSEIYRAAASGDLTRAWALQERLMTLWKLYTHGQWLPCLKAAVNQLGLCGATPCRPFGPVTAEGIAAIRRDMVAAGVLDA